MRIEHDVRPVTYMKTKAAELLRSVAESRRPIIITQSGEPKGVLMDFASYQELRQATPAPAAPGSGRGRRASGP